MTDLLYEREGAYLEGEQAGLAKGLVVGREEGFANGRNEGLADGRNAERREMAKSLLSQGVSVNVIAVASGLSEEEICKL